MTSRNDKNLTLIDILLDRVRVWKDMTPGYSRTNYWETRVGHVFLDWCRAGKPGAAKLVGTDLAWLVTLEVASEPQLEKPQLLAPPEPTNANTFVGQLVIDAGRGVVYFNDHETGRCVLRLGGLSPASLKTVFAKKSNTSAIDVMFGQGVNYTS